MPGYQNPTTTPAGSAPYYTAFAGVFTTLGGDTTETIPVAGVLPTDVVSVVTQVFGAGTTPAVVFATPGTDQIVVELTANPNTDSILQYIVVRAS